ncbi:MAG: cupin domain-containing protein [Bacteroidota bacterium]
MKSEHTTFSNPIIKDRVEILEDTDQLLKFRTYLEAGGGQNELHYHASITETFTMIKGELCVKLATSEIVLKAGDVKTIPQFTHHMFYNKSDSEVVFDVEITHPQNMLKALQIMYGLTKDGKVTKKGIPKNISHTAIGIKMMDAFSPKIPHFIQKFGINTLAFLGKISGLEKKLLTKYTL